MVAQSFVVCPYENQFVHICIVCDLPFYLFWVKTVKVDEVWSESVEDGGEGETVLPGGGHVSDLDVGVPVRHAASPHLQRLRSLHCHCGLVVLN